MKLNDASELLVPSSGDVATALAAVKYLGIGAHPDDLEIMSWHAVAAGPAFAGVVAADGANSPRAGAYAGLSAAQMIRERRREQRQAAQRGGYGALICLGYASADFKGRRCRSLIDDLRRIVAAARPEVVFTHSPCDRHATHVALFMHALAALRELDADTQPQALYGCEVWGGLDWLEGPARTTFDVSAHEDAASELVGLFKSQVAGGKRYDLAAVGRRRANATFGESHSVDRATAAELAMDLSPLLADHSIDPIDYVKTLVDQTRDAMLKRLLPYT